MGKWTNFFLDPDYESTTSGPEEYDLVLKAKLDGGSKVVKVPKKHRTPPTRG